MTVSSRWRDVNPDVIAFDQVTGCAAEVREFKTELREKKPDGITARYDPPLSPLPSLPPRLTAPA